jgi:hypothetical protein
MKVIKLFGNVDEQHRLRAEVPASVPSGPVQLAVLLPEEDDAGAAWSSGAASEWADDLADSRQDIYTLEDGKPVDGPR